MRKNFLMLILFLSAFQASAQIFHPVKWSYAAKKISGTEAVIFLKATIEDEWHIYSVKQKAGGPLKTSFKFIPSPEYVLNGSITEPKPKIDFDKNFEIDVATLERSVVFQQKIKLKKSRTILKINVEFMACNDHQCLPPETVELSIPIK